MRSCKHTRCLYAGDLTHTHVDYFCMLIPPIYRLWPALGLKNGEFAFGISHVFFRTGAFIAFDRIMKADEKELKTLVAKGMDELRRIQFKKAVTCVIILNRRTFRKKISITCPRGLLKIKIYNLLVLNRPHKLRLNPENNCQNSAPSNNAPNSIIPNIAQNEEFSVRPRAKRGTRGYC